MRQFILKLRKILLSNKLYYFLLLISLIYVILYSFFYKCTSKYSINTTEFNLIIKNYKIDGNKLSIKFNNNIIGSYYFESIKEKNDFINTFLLGDYVKIYGSLSEPNNNTIPNTFNYKKYLNNKRIKYIINISDYKLLKRSNNLFIILKRYVYKKIETINNEYLYAFILGDSSYIDSETYNNYRINGVTHLFALSGLHVSLFSSLLLSIINKIKNNELLSFIVTSLFLLFFSFIASFTPSILRSVIFFILSGINKIYYFYIKPKNILYLTFIILVIINPLYIYNTGFILSFTITFFILLYNENDKKSSILRISFISFLSSVPIIINMNYEINILGLFNNLIFIPFVSYIIFPLSLISLLIPLNGILKVFISIMETISSTSSNILNLTLYFSKMSLFLIIIYYLLLILLIKKKKVKVLFIILILIIYLKPMFNSNNYIYFIDVGQGDSALIVTKNNKSILIDTGGKEEYKSDSWKNKNHKFNLMNNSIIPFFKSIGIKKLDYLLLSHGDFDHMGEAINLVNNFKVEKVIFNCGEFNDLEKELIKILDKKNIKYYSCIKELNIDNNKLYFLQTKVYDNENDNSNVIYTELDGYKFMFMGDASTTTEKEIMNKYNLSHIDVLKVGHHGSRTSSSEEFINEINPKYSIISVGKNNRYGHPNKEVLENLKDTKIYRTDKDGSIIFKIKDNKLTIETYTP